MIRVRSHTGAAVHRLANAILFVCLAIGVAGCSFRFLESYDPAIESGISEYHKNTIEYLNRISQNPSSDENSYTSPVSQTYYAPSAAKLSDLVVKADTNS